MIKKPQGHGYMHLEALPGTPYFATGKIVKGHEFHNSRVTDLDTSGCDFAFKVLRGHGINGQHDGIHYKNVLALYNHIHAAAETVRPTHLVEMASHIEAETAMRVRFWAV